VGSDFLVYAKGETGLFGTIFEAWAKHWNLRTSPDDWWLPVITQVAKEIDDKANISEVRQLFRNGKEGKENIVVTMPSFTIYDTNYDVLFEQFAKEIDKRIYVKGYVNTVTSDFTTTTSVQSIASKITLMKLFKKYFDYTMCMNCCGLKVLEMMGPEQDWAHLVEKLRALKQTLAPVEHVLHLSTFSSRRRWSSKTCTRPTLIPSQ
jgi:hypothetical protein